MIAHSATLKECHGFGDSSEVGDILCGHPADMVIINNSI